MWLIKLPFKIIAAIVMFLLCFIVAVCGVLKHLSYFVLGLVFFLMVVAIVMFVYDAEWVNAGFAAFFAFAVFVIMFLAELLTTALEGVIGLLGDFIHS